jgi:hypothetical protein
MLTPEQTRFFTRAGRNFVARTYRDIDEPPPWGSFDGHGPVRRIVWGGGKRPGERPLGNGYVYDWDGAIDRAERDSWSLTSAESDALTLKLGRKPTAGEVYAEVTRIDFERLRAWVREGWWFVGVSVCALPESGELPEDTFSFALWGIESDAGEYLHEVADELADQAVRV